MVSAIYKFDRVVRCRPYIFYVITTSEETRTECIGLWISIDPEVENTSLCGLPSTVLPNNAATRSSFNGNCARNRHSPRIYLRNNLNHLKGSAAYHNIELHLSNLRHGLRIIPLTEIGCTITSQVKASYRNERCSA